MENEAANESKNANNKVDILYNFWLPLVDVLRNFTLSNSSLNPISLMYP